MMRKYVFLTVLTCCLLLCACSKEANDSADGTEIGNTSSFAVDQETQPDALLQENQQKEETLGDMRYSMVMAWDFSDEVAQVNFLKIENETVTETPMAVIDKTGKILFTQKMGAYNHCGNFENGVALCEHQLEGTEEVDRFDVLDKSGNIVFSSADGLFDGVAANGDGFFGVYQYTENFDEAGYRVFFLNNKGENIFEFENLFDEVGKMTYCGEGIFAICPTKWPNEHIFVNLNTHSAFTVKGIACYDVRMANSFSNGVCVVELGEYRTSDIPALIYADGTVKELDIYDIWCTIPGKVSDGGFVFSTYDGDDIVKKVEFYDIATDTVTQLGDYGERVDYTRLEGLYFDDGYMLLPLRGADGKSYYTIIDKSGQNIFDPVICENAYVAGPDRILVQLEDKEIMCNRKGEFLFELPTQDAIQPRKAYINRLQGLQDVFKEVYQCGVAHVFFAEGESGWHSYVDLDGNILFPNETLPTE